MAFYTDGVVPWNSLDNNTRAPLSSELEGGYPCGEADQELFNWTAGWPIGNIWNMILQSGITPDTDKLLDLARAVQSGKVNYAVAGGTANAITASLSPVPASLTEGMQIRLKVQTANTGAATLNLNGLGAVTITSIGGGALNAGDLQPGYATLIYSGTAWVWTGRQRGQLLNVRYITASGNYTPTPGTRSVLAEIQAGGGAGGGAAATGAGQISGGAGGGAGGYAQKYITSGFSGVLITIGAGGTGVVGGTGNSGGATSFGGIFSASGGTGGDFGVASSLSSTVVIGKGLPGTGSGGDINAAGGIGKYAVYATNGSLGGEGGASKFGSGAIPSSGTSSGFAAVSLGSGGGGACLGPSNASAAIGGAGANGLAVIWEYA